MRVGTDMAYGMTSAVASAAAQGASMRQFEEIQRQYKTQQVLMAEQTAMVAEIQRKMLQREQALDALKRVGQKTDSVVDTLRIEHVMLNEKIALKRKNQ